MAYVGISGWQTGHPGEQPDQLRYLMSLNAPGTADDPSVPFEGATPGFFTVYPGFPDVSPDGGNFIQSDGDPFYSDTLFQTINGLTVGDQYTLSFFQAAGQQAGLTGPTTERWQVSFGDETQLSSMYSLPEAGIGPWGQQTMTFTATSASQVLTFLAVGTPAGAPPISFLDGVTLTTAVPEPATWSMMIVGFGLVGGSMRRRPTLAMA